MGLDMMVLGGLGTNCYIITGNDEKHAVIIDPAAEAERVLEFIEKQGYTVEAILITHGHYDHIGAVPVLAEQLGVDVITHELEAEMMEAAEANMSAFFTSGGIKAKASRYVEHGEKLDLGYGLEFDVLIVPGHSPASVCYYCSKTEQLFAGDTLFAGSIGRMDFYEGPEGTLIREVKDKLMTLPKFTKVYPGHGGSTTIDQEMKMNPYL